ncbi:MAG: nitroreductase family protein [Candidatus Omnitrophota bacterium]|nr:nitroreductase family protein [Candidatus Omnitrophota bacterium]
MNEILANIKNRRSRRSFIDKNIPDMVIEEILEAARYAPSGFNKQPWNFIVVSNKDVIRQLSIIIRRIVARIMPLFPLFQIFKPELRDPKVTGAMKKTLSSDTDTVFYNAPLLILVTAAKDASRYAVKDCAFASQNMMLYARSVGISSCFVGRADFLKMSKEAVKITGLPPGYIIHAAIVFGYAPDSEAAAIPERRRDNVISWVR